MKLRQYLTVFPSHFNNIFLKSFRHLLRNCIILQYLMRFHKTNDISWHFSGITLGFHEILKYFVDFQFCLKYLRNMIEKFQLLLNRFKISKFYAFQWRKLKKSILQLPITKCIRLVYIGKVCWQNCQLFHATKTTSFITLKSYTNSIISPIVQSGQGKEFRPKDCIHNSTFSL